MTQEFLSIVSFINLRMKQIIWVFTMMFPAIMAGLVRIIIGEN